jgi:hypothetical protein
MLDMMTTDQAVERETHGQAIARIEAMPSMAFKLYVDKM